MCGIAGIIRLAGGVDGDTDAARLDCMRTRLAHRGPDGNGTFVSPQAGLVHTRLALVDLAGGAQPMRSADGRYVLTYNGEVYNAAELRAELADYPFRTRCDAEVVLAAYARWGADCVPRLNGMFAFFIWDTVESVGFAARDLLGVKPFVYAWHDSELVFASEAKAVLAALPGRPRPNIDALLEYLVVPCFSGVEAPMFEGLAYLPPGHALRITRDGLTTWRWGTHDLLTAPRHVAPDELRDALDRAVQRTLIADVPVGVFLSGGLDSTAIAAFARTHVGHAALPTYTIRFAEHDRYDYSRSRIVISDDEPFAALAAAELGLTREVIDVDRAGIAADLVHLAVTNDALPAWEQEIAQHHLSRAVARTCKAVLVGDAADETHYGYHFLLDAAATHSPRGVIERFAPPRSLIRRDVLSDPVAHFDVKYRALAAADGHAWGHDDPSSATLATTWLVVHRWLPRLLHNGDIHAMAHSLEARVPFADIELLGLARQIGPAAALRDGVEKAALRAALRGVIPEAIRTRRKSALPKDQHVAALYQRECLRALDETEPALREWIDIRAARELCEPTRELDERERAALFRVVSLAHWQRYYLGSEQEPTT